MKKIVYLTLMMFISLSAGALELRSKMSLSDSGELSKYLEVTCTNNTTTCQQLCGNQSICQIPEVLCEDCVSQKSQLMYTIFTDVNSIFKADIMFISEQQLIGFLQKRRFISIPHDIFINMFTPEKKELLKKEFEKLCYINVQSATLLATVNEKNQADELVGVICKDNMGSVVLPMQLNPEFSKQESQFWDKLNTEMGLRADSLKLKMSMELDQKTTPPEAATDQAVKLKMSLELGATEKPNTQDLTISPSTQSNLSARTIEHRIYQTGSTKKIVTPAAELANEEPSICRLKRFSDGTSKAIEKEYWEKCVKYKRKK